MKIGFVGFGLIGGSLAKAWKDAIPEISMTAYDIDGTGPRLALSEGCIENVADGITKEAFGDCDYIFLCAPVSENSGNLKQIAAVMKEGAVLSDVGSVKRDIHARIEELGLSAQFIGGHPMAGSEKTGYENAGAKLFENVYYMITPTEQTPKEQVSRLEELVRKIGAIPLVLSPELHDYVTGAISHLPHVASAALVNLIKKEDVEDGIMKMIAAGGFRDITRISSSSPAMWEAICMTNTDNIVLLLDAYIDSLENVRDTIRDRKQTQIYDFFSEARDYRDSFSISRSGAIRKVYALHADIPDAPGSLAAVAALLASRQISIKNIGIIHNREYEEGVLRVEFYDMQAQKEAEQVLDESGYQIYRK